jgi:hypothetical protein
MDMVGKGSVGIRVGFLVVAEGEVKVSLQGGGVVGVEGDSMVDGAVNIFESIFGRGHVAWQWASRVGGEERDNNG